MRRSTNASKCFYRPTTKVNARSSNALGCDDGEEVFLTLFRTCDIPNVSQAIFQRNPQRSEVRVVNATAAAHT